jgi:hypothetical protein
MKKTIAISLLMVSNIFSNPLLDTLVEKFTVLEDNERYVAPAVFELLKNDGLASQGGKVTLANAVDSTQQAWLKKDWNHEVKGDQAPEERVNKGSDILAELFQNSLGDDKVQVAALIGHGGVLPSAAKMLLAAQDAYKQQNVKKLYVITGNEPFNITAIQKASLQDYQDVARVLQVNTSVITQQEKPQNSKEVINYLMTGFKEQMPDLEVIFVDKKDLPEFAKTHFQNPTDLTVCSSKPQLEAHILTFAQLQKANKNLNVVSGVTAGDQPELDKFYDAQTPEERYTFERNNFARVLFRIQEYLNNK